MKRVLLLLLFALSAQAQTDVTIPCQVLLNREHDGEYELVMRKHGVFAGLYRYRMISPTEAGVTGMFMEEDFKRQNLSGVFVHSMLLRDPNIKKIKALMVMDNLAASGLVWVKRTITDEECAKAVQMTPFVKTFSKYGFSLSNCYWDKLSHYLEIEMSK